MHSPEMEQRFERRIGDHRRIIYKICNIYCSDHEDREDLAQEILVQLWRSFGAFDGRCAFSTWMYRVALNTAISFSRRESVRRRYVVPVEDRILQGVAAPEVETEEMQMLRGLIEELDPFNKALLLLYLDGNNQQEIAEILGITPTNVATKINRLKNALKRKANPELELLQKGKS